MEWGNSRQRGEHAKRHRSEKWQSDAALGPYLKGRWNKWGGWRLSNFQWYIKERATGVVCPRCRQKGGALSVGYLKAIMIKLPTILNNNKTLLSFKVATPLNAPLRVFPEDLGQGSGIISFLTHADTEILVAVTCQWENLLFYPYSPSQTDEEHLQWTSSEH